MYILEFRVIRVIIIYKYFILQVMGTVPTITIDKADGLQMFLSKDSLQVEIVSAKSSALNVMVPQANGDFVRKCTYC